MIVDLLYMDVNKGHTDHAWDRPIEDFGAITALFQQCSANNSNEFQIIIIADYTQVQRFQECLESAQYTDIETVTWVKSQLSPGNPIRKSKRFLRASELIIIARSPSKRQNRIREPNFIAYDDRENHTMERYDFFLGPEKKHLQKHNKVVLNKYEKPEWLASYLAKPYVKMGDNALVFGAGAGGDVAGLLDLGLNVVCIENDNTQYYALQTRFVEYNPAPPRRVPQTMQDITRAITNFAERPWKSDDESNIVDDPPIPPSEGDSENEKIINKIIDDLARMDDDEMPVCLFP